MTIPKKAPISVDHINELLDALHKYVSPRNHRGFRLDFCRWVSNTWSIENHYDAKKQEGDVEFTLIPTGNSLRETIKTYKDFINSATNIVYVLPESHYQERSPQHGDGLDSLYLDCCYEYANEWLAARSVDFPSSGFSVTGTKGAKINIADIIIDGLFLDENLRDAALEISLDYGSSNSSGIAPYHCATDSWAQDQISCEYASWTLDDFNSRLKESESLC
jgi:hypothetical protein